MRSVIIGIGQCGGKVSSTLVHYDGKENPQNSIEGVIAINTAKNDLNGLDIDSLLIGQTDTKGNGVGSNNQKAVEVMREEMNEVMSCVESKITTTTESIILIAGLGGGTGSGGAPTLADELTDRYDIPVYVIGVLPSEDEGGLRKRNAGRSLQTLKKSSDATIVVDNNIWRKKDQTLSDWYKEVNTQIAKRFSLLFRAGRTTNSPTQSVVDTSEIINTLDTGSVAAIGYGETPTGGSTTQQINNIKTATRKGVKNGLSVSGSVESQTGLLLVSGPPEHLSRKGIEKSRKLLEDELSTHEVRGGDLPLPDSDVVKSLVLLGGIQNSDRIDSILTIDSEDRNHGSSTTNSDDDKLFQNDDIDGVI